MKSSLQKTEMILLSKEEILLERYWGHNRIIGTDEQTLGSIGTWIFGSSLKISDLSFQGAAIGRLRSNHFPFSLVFPQDTKFHIESAIGLVWENTSATVGWNEEWGMKEVLWLPFQKNHVEWEGVRHTLKEDQRCQEDQNQMGVSIIIWSWQCSCFPS